MVGLSAGFYGINRMMRAKLINEEQREELLKEEELDLDKLIKQLKQVNV